MIARTWYSSDDAELRRLVAEGLSTYDIAERMGRTRFSIISRMPRIGVRSQLPVRETWTAEDYAQVASMLAKGFTARQIGEKLKLTRNAVLGRMHRLKLKSGWINQHTMGRNPATKEEIAAKRRARQKKWRESNPRLPTVQRALSPIVAAERLATMRRNQERRQAMQTQTSENAVHFLEVTSEKCKWPLWADGAPFSELMCCGAKAEAAGPYCPGHAYRASNWVKGAFVRQPGYFKSWVNTGRAA